MNKASTYIPRYDTVHTWFHVTTARQSCRLFFSAFLSFQLETVRLVSTVLQYSILTVHRGKKSVCIYCMYTLLTCKSYIYIFCRWWIEKPPLVFSFKLLYAKGPTWILISTTSPEIIIKLYRYIHTYSSRRLRQFLPLGMYLLYCT